MYNPVVEIDDEVDRLLEEHERAAVVNASPKCVFDIEQDRIVVAQTEYCAWEDFTECIEKAKELNPPRPGLITAYQDETCFHFDVETTGARAPDDVVMTALQVLQTKFADLRNECENIDPYAPFQQMPE